ncbi:TPA: hypothetical protein ACQZJK_002436 [Klebsiella pneumoniae]
MTKSTITRERLEKIKSWRETYCAGSNVMLPAEEAEELARMALAAIDSEPVRNPVLGYADSYRDMAKQGVESVPIWSVITDLERNIAPLYRHAQPVPVVGADLLHSAASAIEDLLTAKDRTGAGVWFDLPFRLRSAANAQPAQVVQCPFPCGWDNLNKLAIQDAALVARGLVEGELNTEAHRQSAISNNDRLLKVISACRAAMLQAEPVCTCPSGDGSLRWPCPVHPGNSPAQSDCCPAQNGVNPEQKSLTPAQDGNHLVIPDGYVMVPEEPTDEMLAAAKEWTGLTSTAEVVYIKMLAAAPQEVKGD